MWIVFYRPIDDEGEKFAVIAVMDDSMESVLQQVRDQMKADYGDNWKERSIDSVYDLEVVLSS